MRYIHVGTLSVSRLSLPARHSPTAGDRRIATSQGAHVMSHTEPAAVEIPTGTPASVISVRPVVLPAPGRGEDLQVRVTQDDRHPLGRLESR
jgi:hypothetical protein